MRIAHDMLHKGCEFELLSVWFAGVPCRVMTEPLEQEDTGLV